MEKFRSEGVDLGIKSEKEEIVILPGIKILVLT